MDERTYSLGNGLVAIAQPHGRGYKVFLEANIYETPKLLQRNFPSLQEAKEAVEKWRMGRLNPTKLGEGFSLLNK